MAVTPTHTNHEPSFLDRILGWVLAKSDYTYGRSLAGGDAYWQRAIEARQPSDKRTLRTLGKETEYEPVYGMTRRQLEDYLARNPHLRAEYEARLREIQGR